MFALGVSDHLMIAHSLPDAFFGRAQRLHGATYAIELEVRVASLGPHQVVMDIGELRAILRRVIEALEYRNLDEHPAFAGQLSTTEQVARYLAGRVAEELATLEPDKSPSTGATLRVLARESPVAYASFERPV
ncbi:MAG: 6-carboxytetrahydropterin synthase [Myxococcales bacterium]|nr:6-carboxytetrahydropterin synthase [Myxococcales bacterium]